MGLHYPRDRISLAGLQHPAEDDAAEYAEKTSSNFPLNEDPPGNVDP